MDKQNTVCTYNRTALSLQKEGSSDYAATWMNPKGNKPATKRQGLADSTHTTYLEESGA